MALSVLGGLDAAQRRREAATASAVESQVGRVERSLHVYTDLVAEKTASETLVMAQRYGVPAAQAAQLLGIDIATKLRTARSALDRAWSGAERARFGTGISELAVLRRSVDAGAASEDATRSLFSRLVGIAEQDWLAQVDRLNRMPFDTLGSAAVRRAAGALRDAAEALARGSNETSSAASLAVPGLPGAATARQDLAIGNALYLRATSGFPDDLGPLGRVAWTRRIVADPDVNRFQGFVTSLLDERGAPAGSLDITKVATLFHAGLVRQDRLVEVVTSAGADVTRLAHSLRTAANRDLWRYVLEFLALVALSLAIAAATARSIVRPLRRLARRAAEVSSGVLHGEPLDARGPQEVAVVSEAFNETVANLRALDAAALALAAGDFESAALANSAPGRIAASLRRSVETLSQSIRDNEELRRDLTLNERRFRVTFASNPVPMWVCDAETLGILEVNDAAVRAYGYSRDEFLGMRVSELDRDVESIQSEPAHDLRSVLRGGVRHHTTRHGEVIEVQVTTQPLDFAGRAGVLVMAEDVTEQLAAQRMLTYQAMHDSLTGLPNRVLLLDRLEQAISRSERAHAGLGVVFIDLDHFKVVNDAKGHTTGDLLLVEAANRIRDAVRPEDTVARFGGDEFVVVLEGVSSAVEAAEICDRIRRSLAAPFAVAGAELVVTASQGIAIARPGDSVEDLLRTADAAMYLAKERGRNRGEVADHAIRARATRRLEIEADMRRGLDAGEFIPYYQPIVALSDGGVVGAEALVRWNDPERGIVAPDAFIPIAEETGLIDRLGEQVLARALHDAARWPAPGPDGVDPYVSVNVSGRQLLSANLVHMVARSISSAGVDARRLHLEVTESVLMRDIDRSAAVLGEIAALGVHVSIDDFGTGYSSLRYLQRLPIDTLKIDRCFVELLDRDHRDTSIVTAVVNLGRALAVGIVAEGVESAEQLRELRRIGCERAQGFYLAKPMPAREFEALLRMSPRLGRPDELDDVA